MMVVIFDGRGKRRKAGSGGAKLPLLVLFGLSDRGQSFVSRAKVPNGGQGALQCTSQN